MINLCNTLLPNDRAHAIPVFRGKIIQPISVIDKVIEVEFALKITQSFDSSIVFRVLYIFFFVALWFLSLK